MFMARLYGYSHFTGYLSKFHQSNNDLLNVITLSKQNDIENIETRSVDKIEDIEEIIYKGTRQEAETRLENHSYLKMDDNLLEQVNNLQEDKDELT
jgi:hypothetical protein